jgi:hypothetical protein
VQCDMNDCFNSLLISSNWFMASAPSSWGLSASGSQRPDSAINIGLYNDENQPLHTAHIRSFASIHHDALHPTATDRGGWGTWVNG